MSQEYYDSKGIGHYSSSSRDRANEKYLREEQYAREQQVALQAEQVNLARQQKSAQDAHNAKIASIAKKEAAEAKAQREFEKDVLWLEKSDTEGKIEYITNKIGAEFKSESVRIILAKAVNCGEQEKLNRGLEQSFKDLNNADTEWQKKRKSFENHQETLESEKSLEEKFIPMSWRSLLIVLTPALACLAGWIHAKNGEGNVSQIGMTIFYNIIGLPAALFYFIAGRQQIKKIRQTIETAGLKIERLKPEIEALSKKRQEAKTIAKAIYEKWLECVIRKVAESAKCYDESDEANNTLKEKFNDIQLKYPSGCRVGFESIKETFIKQFIETNMSDVRKNVNEHVKSERFISTQLPEAERLSDLLKWVVKNSYDEPFSSKRKSQMNGIVKMRA